MVELFKEYEKSILKTKKNYMQTPEDEKDYNTYLLNRGLSRHLDCIDKVNQMNMMYHLPKKIQYLYYLNIIRSMNRPFKTWYKIKPDENLNIIKEYYKCSRMKAKEILSILTVDELDIIRTRMDRGGPEKNKKG